MMIARTDRTAIPNANDDLAGARDMIIDWFVNEAWRITSPKKLIAETCRWLLKAGVPMVRFNVFMFTLHPDFFGVLHQWSGKTGKVESRQGRHEVLKTRMFQDSPIRILESGASAMRRRLDAPGFVADYPILDEYKDAGATDYVLMALRFSNGSPNAITFTTERKGGFSTAELQLVGELLPYMARLAEVQSVTYLATTLLDTYVGKDAGGKVMVGNIRRGSVETIRAVVWLCDLRDFAILSEQMSGEALIGLLNDYFDCVGRPVRQRGGEILKFIGDAMLAIFRIANEDELDSACSNALEAADEAQGLLATMNEARRKAGEPPVAVGIGLHVGDVMYGNIGAADRLDFTVIGPAVNLAARIEGLCRELGRPVILSKEFAQASGAESESLGKHKLKGLAGNREVFAPRAAGA